MALRVALVTPSPGRSRTTSTSTSQGLHGSYARAVTDVTVLGPSNRARDLGAGRRALARGLGDAEFVALGPAVPISRRSRIGVPVGVRANLAVALATGGFDIVHGFEPGLPSLSYLALRDASALDRRDVLLAGAALVSARRARAASGCSAGSTRCSRRARRQPRRPPSASRAGTSSCPPASTSSSSRPRAKRKVVVLEWRQAERPLLRALARELAAQPDWELVLLRTRPLGSRPPVPRALRGRMRVRTALDGAARAEILREAAVFVPAVDGVARVELEARAAGAAVASPPGRELQPELAAAEAARLVEDDGFRAQRARRGPRARREARELRRARRPASTAVYDRHHRAAGAPPRRARPLDDRDRIVVDLHMHTTWSHDCSIEVDDLLDHAEAEGLGAIAVTDHNVFGGALEAAERARGREPDRHPRRGGEDRRPGRGDRPLPRARRSRAACRSPTPSRRSAPRAASSTSPTRSTACTRSRTPRRSTATSPRSTSSRSTTRACSSRRYNVEALAIRAEVQPHRGRRLRRARAPGRRHGRRADAPRSRARRSSSSRSGTRRSCAARSRSRTSRD